MDTHTRNALQMPDSDTDSAFNAFLVCVSIVGTLATFSEAECGKNVKGEFTGLGGEFTGVGGQFTGVGDEFTGLGGECTRVGGEFTGLGDGSTGVGGGFTGFGEGVIDTSHALVTGMI
jgi:hypothetical protein